MKIISMQKTQELERKAVMSKCNCGSCNCNCGAGSACHNKCMNGEALEFKESVGKIYTQK